MPLNCGLVHALCRSNDADRAGEAFSICTRRVCRHLYIQPPTVRLVGVRFLRINKPAVLGSQLISLSTLREKLSWSDSPAVCSYWTQQRPALRSCPDNWPSVVCPSRDPVAPTVVDLTCHQQQPLARSISASAPLSRPHSLSPSGNSIRFPTDLILFTLPIAAKAFSLIYDDL